MASLERPVNRHLLKERTTDPLEVGVVGCQACAGTIPIAQGSTRTVRITPRRWWYAPVKAVGEYLFACILFLLSLPVILICALIVKRTSPGPAFYKQVRIGKNGREFTLWKLRTMVDNAEDGTGAVWSQSNDPRITPFGRFLRDSHLDEFPQLINVLLGDMALVGPRPERPEFVSQLEFRFPNYSERHNVRPGITGFAQVSLPADSGLESVRLKLLRDLYYVNNLNYWLDTRILVTTGWKFTKTLVCVVWYAFALPKDDRVCHKLTDLVGSDSHLFVPVQDAQEVDLASDQETNPVMQAITQLDLEKEEVLETASRTSN